MQNIKIDPEQLGSKINRLKTLYSDCETNSNATFAVTGKGQTNIAMDELDTYFLALDRALASLIQSTVELLSNAKDGYVNTDESTAKLMQKLQGEVFKK